MSIKLPSHYFHYLFAYGTLQNSTVAAMLDLGLVEIMCYTHGKLYNAGPFPMAIKDESGNFRVYGNLYGILSKNLKETLKKLDRYEGQLYEREKVTVFLPDGITTEAWTYFASKDIQSTICLPKRQIKNGIWAKEGNL